MSVKQKENEEMQEIKVKPPENKGYSFVVGMVIAMAIIALMVIFFNG